MQPMGQAVAFAAAGAIAALLAGGAWLLSRRGRLTRHGIHVEMGTLAGPALVFDLSDEEGCPVRMLWVDGTLESATYLDGRRDEPVFDYLRAFDAPFEAGLGSDRVLVMGGGGCSYPRHLVAGSDDTVVDVVELDPAIVRIARRHFFLDEAVAAHPGRIRLHVGDGRAFLEASTDTYDAIVNDSFSGRRPAASLATIEAAQLARSHLSPGGCYMANVVSAVEGPGSGLLWAVVSTLEEAFAHVHVLPCGDLAARDNVVVVATDAVVALDQELPLPAHGLPLGSVLRDAGAQGAIDALVRQTTGDIRVH